MADKLEENSTVVLPTYERMYVGALGESRGNTCMGVGAVAGRRCRKWNEDGRERESS